VTDPLFVDPTSGNFNVEPDSPALKLGFEPIDISRVGPRGWRFSTADSRPGCMQATI
jgi:hypothetical protein